MVMNPNISMALPPDYLEEIQGRGTVGPNPPGTAGVKPLPPNKDSGGLGGPVYSGRGGRGGRGGVYQNYGSTAGLPTVTDPDKAFANITRQEYLDYIDGYRPFEEGLIEQARTDTSLIDQAREDVEMAQGLAEGVASRNMSRYGASLTPAQMQQQSRQLQRANTLGGIQSVNDARINQKEANTRLLSDLINIGQGVNRSSQQQLGSAAADATQRNNAYTQARAQSRAQTYSTMGQLGASAILAAAIFF
jgi:hypothetical protein